VEDVMDSVRTLAGIFYTLGWIMVVVAGLLGLTMLLPALFALGRTGVGDFISALTSVAALGVASLSPFFCAAVLEALVEIHALQHSVLRAAVRVSEAAGASTFGTPALAIAASSPMRSFPRTITVTAPDPAPRTIECPNCGRPNATWRTICADCQATLA